MVFGFYFTSVHGPSRFPWILPGSPQPGDGPDHAMSWAVVVPLPPQPSPISTMVDLLFY